MKMGIRRGRATLLALCVTAALVSLLMGQVADAGPCKLVQDPYWATYTGGEEGCGGEAYNCQVFVYECD